MAEALGIASSIVALVQLSASVYSATSKFYREAKEAKSKIGALATQTRNLSGILQSLSLLAASPLFDDAGAPAPDFRDTYIESCYTTLHRIQQRLENAESDFKTVSHRKLITRSLKWPFESQETKDLVDELGHHRDILQLALSADTMSHLLQCLTNTKSVAKSVEDLNRKLDRKESIDTRAQVTAKRERIIQFFLKINPEDHFQECRRRRHPDTGRWLIERDQTFRDWIIRPGSQIWLYGIAGAGKTILCGAVVDEILQMQDMCTAVAFFFCDYRYTESQNPINILAALAVQLATQADEAFEVLESYHEELHPHNGIRKPPETKRMIQVVQAMIGHYKRTYLAVDGLDECGLHSAELVQSLKQLTQGNQVNMALFSRKELEIEEELENSSSIEIAARAEDLELYVLAQMESRKRLASLAVKNPELHEHIRRTLIEGANGMFRWVACQLDHLGGLASDGRRRRALSELPPTLFETYDRILDRIMGEGEHDQELCRKALHWIGLGYKKIDPLALCEGISIPDDQDLMDKELVVDPDWISRSCSSLIRLAGQESDYPHFELAHFTVKEYLRSIKPGSKRSHFRYVEDTASRELLGSSLKFLAFPIFDRRPTIAASEIQKITERNAQHPFYSVAAGYMFCCGNEYWDDSLGEDLSLLLQDNTMMQHAIKLFDPEKRGMFLSWILQAMWYWPETTLDEQDFFNIIGLILAPEFSTLHMAASLALLPICMHLLNSNQVNLNAYCRLGTPLHALLAGPDLFWPGGGFRYDPRRHYPFHAGSRVSAYDRRRQCLETFVEHRGDTSIRLDGTSTFQMAINSSVQATDNKLWIEPLINASTVINEDCIAYFKNKLDSGSLDPSIVDTVFTLGSRPDISSGWARLASLVHTKRMEEKVSEGEHLQRDLEYRISDEDFFDAVRISLDQNLTDTLRILVQDPRFHSDSYIPYGNSRPMPILHFAIRSGSLGSVQLLLEVGCDPKVIDQSDQWTTLHQCALSDGYDAEITALLLNSGVVDSAKNDLGETCWHIAAEQGNIPVLKVLFDLGCDTDKSLATISHAGRTPLASAILNAEVETALMLLNHCSTQREFYQSDRSLLNKAAAIGSDELFQCLHEKLAKAKATDAIQFSKPLENINMMCSPRLLDYLMNSWAAGATDTSHFLENYLLDANISRYEDPGMYPWRADMSHIIQRLLPPNDAMYHDGNPAPHYWTIFCEKVVSNLTKACGHEKAQCRTGLISMIFEIVIQSGVLDSYERCANIPSYEVLFRSLLDRGDHIRCSWIASSVQKVIEASTLATNLANQATSNELLLKAVQESNVELVRQLLDHGVDIHAAHGPLSPVEQACYTASLPIFHLVIQFSDRMLINRTGSQGKTLLHWAVSGTVPGYLSKIQQLLKLGANIESKVKDPNAHTALTLASQNYRQDIVALLVSEGANTLHRGRDGWSILHAAAATGDLRYIQSLLPPKAPMSFWLGTCESPLLYFNRKPHITENTKAIHLAACNGRSNFLRFMIQNHVPLDVDAVTGNPFLTPLHLACFYGHLEIVEILVSLKANVNARSGGGTLAIDLAARNNHLGVFKKLLKSGSEKPSSLFSDLVTKLMAKDAECMEDAREATALSRFDFEKAIIRGDIDRCRALMAKGQSINKELITQSYTPLVRAVVEGQTDIVDWLISLEVEVKNPIIRSLHPSLRCIASLSTHHIPSARTLSGVMGLALKQNVSWYESMLSPLHIAILDNKTQALDVILKHIRKNDHAYWKVIESCIVLLPEDTRWSRRRALPILVNNFSHEAAFSDSSPWGEEMPPGSPLHWAIRYSNIDAVTLLLKNEADMNEVDASGRTPLLLAVSSSHPTALLQQLLQAGAGLKEPSSCRIDAMNLAIRKGKLEIVKILAEADPETLKSVDQYSADSLLRMAGSSDVFQYLVSQGIDPVKVTGVKDSPVTFHMTGSLSGFVFNSGLTCHATAESMVLHLAQAATSGNLWVIKAIYRTLPKSLFATLVNRTKYGIASALCVAAVKNAAKLATELINMGAKLDSEGCVYGSALMAASVWGCLDVARCLVRSGAALCYVNEHGSLRSAVSLSLRHGKVTRWFLVDRHVEQRKLEHQPQQCASQQVEWSGPRLFKLALPTYMKRDSGESRWSHLRRLQKWKQGLLGATLAESRGNSGLDFKAELEFESRKSEAQAAHRQFLSRVGED